MAQGLRTSARIGKGRTTRGQGNLISAVSVWSGRNPLIVLLLVVSITVGVGAGIPLIDTDVDVADVLPRGDPNTAAAKNVTAQFKSAYTQQASVSFFTNPAAWQRDNERLAHRNQATIENWDLGPHNITDEVYVRAIEEFYQYVVEASDGTIRAAIGVPSFYKLINWTVAGGNDITNLQGDAAYSLPSHTSPAGAIRYDAVHALLRSTIGETVDAVINPVFEQHTLLLLVDPDEPLSSRDIGQVYMDARDAYNEAARRGELQWTVFGPDNPPLFIVDSPIANAHGSTLTNEDLARLAPLVAAFLFITLYIAFRNIVGVLISGATLVMSAVWTYGTMGYMGIPLNTLNLTVVPLIMGVGIDYTVHMVNEFLEHKSEGLSDEEAFRTTGTRAGFAMFIATLTTVIGLMVMTFSPSLLMAQLGFLSALAIASTYLLTISFIPAALSLVRNTSKLGASFKPSTLMPNWASNVSRHRGFWTVLVVLVTFVTIVNTGNLEKEAFGDPGSNFPESDPIRQEHERSLKAFYDTHEPSFKTNILVFEGNVLSYEAHQYIKTIEENLKTKPSVDSATLRNILVVIESWLLIREGGVSAAQGLAFQQLFDLTGLDLFDQYPQTQDDIEDIVHEMWSTPYRETVSLFINYPHNDITTMTFAVRSKTFLDAEQAWNDVQAAIEESAHAKPDDLQVAFVGNTATNYLFIEKQLPWLTYMSVAASLTAIALMAFFTRDLKATFTVAALMLMTTIWFMGVLPWLGIGLAITLMLPMVFIFNIGTDYAVHLVWNLKKMADPRAVFANVGKAILFSAITTIGAFAFFIPIRNVAMSKTMLATAVAITVIFFATVIIVSLIYKIPARDRHADEEELEFEEVPADPRGLRSLDPDLGPADAR